MSRKLNFVQLPPVPLSMDSPYAYPPNQVDPTYAQPHQNGHVNFSFEDTSYMIMSGAQSATELEEKRLSEGELGIESGSRYRW